MSVHVTNGASSPRGIYLAGMNGSTTLAAYAYRMGGQLRCKTGTREEMDALYRKHREMDYVDKDGDLWKVALMFVIPIALIVAAVIFAQNAFQIAGVAAFAIIAAFPCYALSLIGENNYASKEIYQKLQRHHGAEHTLFAYIRKNHKNMKPTLAAEDLEGYGYLDRECGTVWMATLIIWAAALGLAIAFVPTWGASGAAKLVAIVTVLLLLNIYANPANPLLSIQKPEVAQPTLKELEVATTAFNALHAALEQGVLINKDQLYLSSDENDSDLPRSVGH